MGFFGIHHVHVHNVTSHNNWIINDKGFSVMDRASQII